MGRVATVVFLGILLFSAAASGQQNIGGGYGGEYGGAAPAGASEDLGGRYRDFEFDAEDLTKRVSRLSSRVRGLEDDLGDLEDRIGTLWIAIIALGLGLAVAIGIALFRGGRRGSPRKAG